MYVRVRQQNSGTLERNSIGRESMREERETTIAEALYYHVARDALEAGQEAERFERAQSFAICMVFSVLCLEAYINRQLGASSLPDSEPGWERELRHKQKWLTCPHVYGADQTFDRGALPFQDFSRLIRLRNRRLVHFKPGEEMWVDGQGSPSTSFRDVVLDERLAARSFDSVRGMIHRLHELTDGQTELPNFLDGVRYLKHVSVSLKVAAEHLGSDGRP